MLGVERGAGPYECADHEDAGAEQVNAVGSSQFGWADQQGEACEAQEQADENEWDGAGAAGAEPVHDDKPEGYGGYQEGSDAGGYTLLGPA